MPADEARRRGGRSPRAVEAPATQLRPVVAWLFVVIVACFFGGSALLVVDLFTSFLPDAARIQLALGLGALVVLGIIAGICWQAVQWLRHLTIKVDLDAVTKEVVEQLERDDDDSAITHR